MGNDLVQVKNLNNTVKDLQKQISQLKSQQKVFSQSKRGEYVLKCNADTVEFKKYDLCKVVGGTVYKFNGTETYATDLLPGIVISGNTGDSDGEVLVLVNGVSYAVVSEDVIAGQLLYPYDSDYTKASLTGNVGYWKALESGSTDELVKVSIIYGTGGGGFSEIQVLYPCKIRSYLGLGIYEVQVYPNGKDDYTNYYYAELEILEEQINDVLPVDTWLMAGKYQLEALGEH